MKNWVGLSAKTFLYVTLTAFAAAAAAADDDDHDDDDDDNDTYEESEISLSRTARFWLLLCFIIPSILCSFFLLFHLLINRALRSQLANHVMIVLLVGGLLIELIDIPFHLSFFHSNYVQPSTPALCQFWWFLDLGIYNGCIILMAWNSVERYLLIYYDRLFRNRNKRLILHYFPVAMLLIYIMVFYIIAIIFPPCTNKYNYTLPVCNDFPCYLNHPVLGIMDSIVNNIVPVIIICVFNFILVIRVYCQKRRLQQVNIWRKQRKMTVQLVCTCTLYLIPNMPLSIFIVARLCGLPEDTGVEFQIWFDFLCYFVPFLYPFICLASASELRRKLNWRRLFLLEQHQLTATVRPQFTASGRPQVVTASVLPQVVSAV